MLKQKKDWVWLTLAILVIVFLTSCNLGQADYQHTHKLLTFQFRDTVVQDWNQSPQEGTGIGGIRIDGAVRIAKPSSYKFKSTPSVVADGSGQYYRFKQDNLSVEELAELENLITAAEKTRWVDKECNISSTSHQNIQIDFYNKDKKVNRMEICFSGEDDQYLPPDLPENVSQLVAKLISIKEDFNNLSWSEHEARDPLNWDWWLKR